MVRSCGRRTGMKKNSSGSREMKGECESDENFEY